jgi:hypothetical protein
MMHCGQQWPPRRFESNWRGKRWHISSDISGNTTVIRLSDCIDYTALSHLLLKTVLYGSWETPQSERVKGFVLRSISRADDQHVINFYRVRITDDEIHEISEAFAAYLGVELLSS